MFKRDGDGPAPADPLNQFQIQTNRAAVRDLAQRRQQRKRVIWRSVAGGLALLIIAAIIFIFTAGSGKFKLSALLGSQVARVTGHAPQLAGQSRGRTNMLVYGMTQDGLRTDSIILMSYYWQQKKLVTLNIPRDLYVYDGFQNDKMGEVYAYAKDRQPRNAHYPDEYVASVISKEYGIPIDYWVQFNMQGEVDFVNAIGGVDINVANSFTDCAYPTWNYSGYIRPCPGFKAGLQHMNGSTSLIFSRSRHSFNVTEATDFARSKRQALVIQAIMTKLKALGVVGNVTQISRYLTILGKNITTSMTTGEMVAFAEDVKNLSPTNDYVKAAWATGNGFLCDGSTAAGAYITEYGIAGNCGVGAGGTRTTKYRQLGSYFVQNMLTSGGQSPDDFVTTGLQALGYLPKPTPTTMPASSR